MTATKRVILAAMTSAGCGGAANAAIVLSENFEGYADSTPLRAAWTGSTPTALNLNTTGFDPTPSPLPTQTSGITKMARFASGNSGYKALTASISRDDNWEIQIDLMSEGYSRSSGIGLTNAGGTAGYTVQWNTAAVNNNSGRGVVSIGEYSSASPLSGATFGTAQSGTRPIYANDPGTGLPTGSPTGFSTGTSANSLHPSVGFRVTGTAAPPNAADQNQATYDSTFRGLAHFTLKYTAPTTPGGSATLALFNSGSDNPNPTTVALISVTDTTPFASGFNFDRFYIMGTNGNFDNIQVTAIPVPEPAALWMLGLGGVMLVRQRRTKSSV